MPIDKKKNCLNLIRLIAATQVFVGHVIPAFSLTLPWPLEWLFKVLFVFEGVPVFFCLSGFLLWDSIERTPTFKGYLKKRVFRLYPELWAGVILNCICMLILFWDSIEWISFILFQFTQGSIVQFWTPDSLRGYATGTPNGPLWTICVLIQAYVALWFFRKFLHKKGLKRWIITLVLTTLINLLRPMLVSVLPSFLYSLSFYVFISHIWLFLVGAFVSEYFDKIIVYLKRFWWLALIVSQVAMYTGFDYGTYGTIKSLFLGIGVIGLGYALPRINVKYDVSYGIYIYHMIVVNVMVALGCRENIIWLFVSYAVSLVLATISYFTVGSISRRLRKKATMDPQNQIAATN
ncbi:MAG: acyltransferase [Clostridia bacterium]|nr:acyltransferase [Clostridia bacterium]